MTDFRKSLDTPVAVIDLDIVERNIARMQSICDAVGVRNTPHFKTHKSVRFAKMQMEAGAAAICCQKLGEAEVLAQAGIGEVIITYNVLGAPKAERLRAVAQKTNLTLICDNVVVMDFLAQVFTNAPKPIDVLVECDTGQKRSGVVTPVQAADRAAHVAEQSGLRFAGFLFYPPVTAIEETRSFLSETRKLCADEGLTIARISSGGTPGLINLGALEETEYRAGTNIFNDRMMMGMNVATEEDCGLTIYSTLVSSAEPGRGILDAGSKTQTSDLTIFNDFGLLRDYPEAKIYKQAEEHGFLDFSECSTPPVIGEVLRIIPNHVCPVVNLMDEIPLVRGDVPTGMLKIDARGLIR